MEFVGRAVVARVSRDDGFAVMDVSSDIVNDPKVRKLYRHAPDHAGVAFIAYVATMGESWKQGRRMTIDDAWPAFLPFDKPAVEALVHVGLIDARGYVTAKAWRGWFEVALQRRSKSRDRWARYNAQRNADTTSGPRGSDAVTASSVPSAPSVSPSVSYGETGEATPPPAELGRRANGTNPRSLGTNPRAKGTSPRQERTAQKRGPLGSATHQLLSRAAAVGHE